MNSGDIFDVKISSPKGGAIPNKIVDHNNGKYTVTYTPLDTGRHSVAIGLKGKPISGSPYNVPIERTCKRELKFRERKSRRY